MDWIPAMIIINHKMPKVNKLALLLFFLVCIDTTSIESLLFFSFFLSLSLPVPGPPLSFFFPEAIHSKERKNINKKLIFQTDDIFLKDFLW